MILFNIIVAVDNQNGIGKSGQLPWVLSADLKYFKDLTTKTQSPLKKNAVIMGRKTWDSIPVKFCPLPGRINIVLSRNDQLVLPAVVLQFGNLEEVFKEIEMGRLKNDVESVYVIGGQQIFKEALKQKNCQRIYITHIHHSFNCDTFFPPYKDLFIERQSSPVQKEGSIFYHFSVYER